MKTTVIAALAIVGLLATGAASVALAHSGFTIPGLKLGSENGQGQNQNGDHQGNQTSSNENDNETDDGGEGGHLNFTVGSTFMISNLTGHWVSFSHSGEDDEGGDDGFNSTSGNSTGSFTFKVINSSDDLALGIVSGTFSINGTAYTVTGGNLTLNEGDEVGMGWGTASNGANFTIGVSGIHGNTTSSSVGAIRLDVKVGSSDFLVILGNGQGAAEEDGGD